MKKIFVPVLTLLIACFAAQGYAAWGERYSHNNREGNDSLFSSDSDGYWLNSFRTYKKYPINFYSQRLLNKNSSEQTQQIEAHEYQYGVPVTARLGQRMYDSTTYTVTTRTGGEQYSATSDGVLYNGQNEIKIHKGQIFTPIGEIKVNGQYYVLFEVPDSDYIIAADYKGRFLDAIGLIESGSLYVAKDFTIVRPKDLSVEAYQNKEQDTGDAELNFEIRYGGIENNNIVFIIGDDRGEEYEQIQYAPVEPQMLQISGVNFEIIHASPDYVEYKILGPDAPVQPQY